MADFARQVMGSNNPNESYYGSGGQINYSQNVVNDYRIRDQQNADRAKFNSVVDRGTANVNTISNGFLSKHQILTKPLIPGIYDNSFSNLGYQIGVLENAIDGRKNGTGLPPAPIRVALAFLPPVSIVNGGKTLFTGNDLYNRNANTFIERGVLAPFNVLAPFLPLKIQNEMIFKMLDVFDKGKTIFDELIK